MEEGCRRLYGGQGISNNLREASANNHHLAIPPHPKQDLDVDPLDYNDSILTIHLSSDFFYPSTLGFCHPLLIPVRQIMAIHIYNRRFVHRYRRYENAYLLFHKF